MKSRALVPALSVTLLCSWGSLYYAFAVLARPVQSELNISAAQAMGAHSAALLVWGLGSYPVGRWMHRHGGRRVMALGSALAGVLFAAVSQVQAAWLFQVLWAGMGAAMAMTLYEPAFAVVVAARPGAHRRPIGVLTLVGGLASTAFWPLSHVLVECLGWRHTLLVFSAMHLLVCAPLHAWALPRGASKPQPAEAALPPSQGNGFMRRFDFWLLLACFVAFGFVTSAMAMHMISLLESRGVAPALAVSMAALVGPMQVAGRSMEVAFGTRVSPLAVGTTSVLLVALGLTLLWSAGAMPLLLYAFVVAYGAGLGLLTIVRAVAPVELFGREAYALAGGALSGPSLVARAAGPLVATWVLHGAGGHDTMLLLLIAVAAAGALAYGLAMFNRAAVPLRVARE